jgi:hypothetical protein
LWTSGNCRGSSPLSTSTGQQWRVHISDDLKGSTHTDSVAKNAQQCLFNLRRLKKFVLAPKTLTNFYRGTIESILSGCITAWHGNCTDDRNRRSLQRVVQSAQRITGANQSWDRETEKTASISRPSDCLTAIFIYSVILLLGLCVLL